MGQAMLQPSLPRWWPKRRVCAILTGLLVCAPALSITPLFAKEKKPTTKTLTGLVMDRSDNGIDGATVTLKDLQTGVTTAVYTQAGGHYQFYDLKPSHDYEVQAANKGEKSEVHQVSSVDPRLRIVINFTIPPPGS
jgi:carboxypeptidase family protein